MNSFQSQPVQNEFNIRNLKHKKKNMPISINSNPKPGQFLFGRKISKIATSYKDNGEKFQNIEKVKKMMKSGKTQINFQLNNYLSINSKLSQLSNASILTKNSSKIASSRIVPAKNLSTSIFSKGNLLSKINFTKKNEQLTNRINSTNENSQPKYASTSYGKNVMKKNIKRQKSIGVISTNYSLIGNQCNNTFVQTHIKNYTSNNNIIPHSIKMNQYIEEKNKKVFNNNFIKQRVTSSKNKTKEKLKNVFKKPKIISTNPLNEMNSQKQHYNTSSNEAMKNAITTLSSLSNTLGNNCVTLNNKSRTKVNKRGFSYDNEIPKEMRVHSSIPNQQKDNLHQKRNHSLNLNRFALNNFIISINNERKNKKERNSKKEELKAIPGTIEKQGVKRNLNIILNNITVKGKKKDSRNSELHYTHQRSLSKNNIENAKIAQEDENDGIKNENKELQIPKFNNLNQNLFEDEEILFDEPPEVEDKFDDLNSIVRRIHFSLTTSRSLNIFSIDSNEKYQQYEEYFDKEFERKVQLKHNIQFSSNTKKNHTISKGITKSSERKSVNNISLSTQESSYKKYFGSPLHH